MNRFLEHKSYRIREVLEEVMQPWPIGEVPKRTLSDLQAGLHGVNLPRAIPRVHPKDVECVHWKEFPENGPKEEDNASEEDAARKKKTLIDSYMKALDLEDVVLPGTKVLDPFGHQQSEPDESWAMLISENEARMRFESFLKLIRRYFGGVGTDSKQTIDPPKYEFQTVSKQNNAERYYDRRCDDPRKMMPRIYEAPPYPEYWILKKKREKPRVVSELGNLQ